MSESSMEIMFSKCNYSIPAFDSHFSPSKHNRFYIRWEKSSFEKGFDNRAIPRRASYLQRSENERRHSKGIPTVKLSQPILSKLKSQINFSCTMFNAYVQQVNQAPVTPKRCEDASCKSKLSLIRLLCEIFVIGRKKFQNKFSHQINMGFKGPQSF